MAMARFKHDKSIGLIGLHPVMVMAYVNCASVFNHYGHDCVLTGGQEYGRSTRSYHRVGLAFDLRANHLPDRETKRQIYDELGRVLGPWYDVILHGEGANEHYHIEYDPKW